MLRSTNEWQSLDSRHFMHPFTDSKDLGRNGTRIITKAEGVYLWDSEGNQIIDGMAGLWCVNVGYGREELAKAAYKQLQQLPYYNSFFQCTNQLLNYQRSLRKSAPLSSIMSFTSILDLRLMTLSCKWFAIIGSFWGSPRSAF